MMNMGGRTDGWVDGWMDDGWISWLTHVRVKLFTSDWNANIAKTHGLPTEITDLVSGPNEAQVPDVSSQKEFSERQSDR